MNSCIATERSCTWKVLLLATAFLIWNAAQLCAQSNSFDGLVVGMDGNPLPGVAVRAKPESTNRGGLATIVTQTNSAGQYRFEDIPSGTYDLSAGTEDGKATTLHTVLITSFDSTLFLSSTGTTVGGTDRVSITPILMGPARIAVPYDTAAPFQLIILPSTVSASGRLELPPTVTLPPMRADLTRTAPQAATGVDNLPGDIPALSPPAPAVRVFRVRTATEFTVDASVQPDGSFQFPQVPPGTYVLRLNPNLGVPPVTITVADQNITGITVGGKSAGVRVSGTTARSDRAPFKDKFPEWVYLVARDATEFQPSQRPQFMGIDLVPVSDPSLLKFAPSKAYFDAVGDEFDAPITPVLADGRFDFLAVPAGDYYIRTLPESGLPDSVLTVIGDKDIDNVHVGDGARVRGEVVATNSGSRPPEVISLISTRQRGQSFTALVDARGSFEFPKIGAGTYRVLLDGTTRPTPSEVSVGDDDVIFRVETPFAAWVSGRVVFDGPSPPADGLDATSVALTNGHASSIKPDGSFNIKSDEGEFEFFMISLPEGYILKSAVSSSADLLKEPVKVDLRIPTPEILVTLQYRPETHQ